MKNIVIISAHPDDEILGAGGTLLKHRDNGDNIYWIIITNISEKQGFSAKDVNLRQAEIKKVANILDIKKTFSLDYPTMSLNSETVNEMIPKLSKVFSSVKPEFIYCLNRSDAHSDHRFTFDAVMACTKSFRYPYLKRVLMYECISETEFAPPLHEKAFIPNYFVDVSDFINKKIDALRCYASEMRKYPHARSYEALKSLSKYRGSSVGVKDAEAFCIERLIN